MFFLILADREKKRKKNKKQNKTEKTNCRKTGTETYLAIQWLRLHASNEEDKCSIPGCGIKIPHGVANKQTKTSNLRKTGAPKATPKIQKPDIAH